MKKLFYFILCSILVLSGCQSGYKYTTKGREQEKEELIGDRVKIPYTYFKSTDEVKQEFEEIGLVPEFVPTNMQNQADVSDTVIEANTCGNFNSEADDIEYLTDIGDDSGYYAEKGTTIQIPCSDNRYVSARMQNALDNGVSEETYKEMKNILTTFDSLISQATKFVEDPSEYTVSNYNSYYDRMSDNAQKVIDLSLGDNGNIGLTQIYLEIVSKQNQLITIQSNFPEKFSDSDN